jgi:hypothetical protein
VSAGRWPFPGDAPLVRARRVALAYRTRLADLEPGVCAEMDERMTRWGETWVVPRLVTFDADDQLTPAQAAELACVRIGTLRVWRQRNVLKGRCVDGKWWYRAGDVQAMSAQGRRRGGSR